jgi:hypothetical protein
MSPTREIPPVRSKLLFGQYFIYSLRVIEYYLRVVAKNPQDVEAKATASVEALAEEGAATWNAPDQEMLELLRNPLKGFDPDAPKDADPPALKGYKGVPDGVVAPRASVEFSSVILSHMMNESSATLNNYLQIFAKKRRYFEETYTPHLSLEAKKAWVDERMSSTPYHVRDTRITTNLASLVRWATTDSGLFKGLNLFYYLFYRWHRIDYSHIRAIEEAGVNLPYRDELMEVLRLLEERRLNFDSQEVKVLINEYFEYYARFISDPHVINALDYSYQTCSKYNSPIETERMLRDLWTVHRAFYRIGQEAPRTVKSPPRETGMKAHPCLSVANSVWLYEEPRILEHLSRAFEQDLEGSWEDSFANAFANAVERKHRTDAILAELRALATNSTVFTKKDCEELGLLLETANMTPRDVASASRDTTHFTSNIHYYNAVDESRFVRFEDLGFPLPYYPLIDSALDTPLDSDKFRFEADPSHIVPPLEVGPFTPLLDDLFNESRLKAMGAGYPGVSEFKIYLYGCERDDDLLPHYTFKAGKCDYFTGVARKDLFSRFLVPSTGNLRQPLLYLLERGTLPEFVVNTVADEAQRRYREMADRMDPPNARLSHLFADNPQLEAQLMLLLKFKIDELYARTVAASHRLDENGGLHILDNGATYTGCGTFVLTGDRDAAGHDRPLLLLEKRWRVSEENDNLSYPSGGSCDLYIPDDRVPGGGYVPPLFSRLEPGDESQREEPQRGGAQQEGDAEEDCEYLKELEASPFLTATRELREELNLICRPEDLQLVSFGIDVNRNLQQFSFVLETAQTARRILKRKRFAATPREGFTFILPFERRAICDVLNNYQMESGAVYSLMRLLKLKAHRLWPDTR